MFIDLITNFLEPIWPALVGGMLIGIAATVLLVLNGRVVGISGILNGIFTYSKEDTAWRLTFILGLLSGGISLLLLKPEAFENTSNRPFIFILIAGFLVGFGTVMGSGCTSGHGVCGISRFSPRSIVATILFIGSGMLAAAAVKMWLGKFQ